MKKRYPRAAIGKEVLPWHSVSKGKDILFILGNNPLSRPLNVTLCFFLVFNPLEKVT